MIIKNASVCFKLILIILSVIPSLGLNSKIDYEISDKADYSQVLDEYREFIQSYDYDTETGKYYYTTGKYTDDFIVIIEALNANISQGFDKDGFGYVLKDINNDGISELFLVRTSENGCYVLVIYSFSDGEPVCLKKFWNRSRCVLIDDDGTIYYWGSGGACHSYRAAYRIAEGGGSLITVDSIYKTYEDYDRKLHYYYENEMEELSVEDGEKRWKQLEDKDPDNEPPLTNCVFIQILE